MSVQKALSIAQQAVVADQSQNYPDAHYLYKQVVSELENVLYQEQENSPQYQAISAKISEYRFRIAEIEQILASQGYPPDEPDYPNDDKEGPYPENMFPEIPPGTVVTVPDAPSAAQHQPELNKVHSVPSSGSLYVKPTVITKPAGSDEKVIGMYNLKLPSEMPGSEAWQTATELVARGKTKERMGEILDSFELYKCSMLYYMRALNSDDVLTRDMKRVCREQMKEYLTKAENLKKKLVESGIDPNDGLDGNAGADPYQQTLAAYYGNTSEGLCCICGLPLDKFICVLNRQWHPRCFVNTVKCAFCGKPFSLIDFRYVVDKETGMLYHVDCRDYTTGLVQQERREGKPGVYLFYQIENSLSYKINSIRITLVREEARSTRNAIYERVESKPVMTPVVTVNVNFNGKLPLGKGKLSERVSIPLDANLLPSVLTDYTLRREYRLNVKAMLSGMNGSIDKTFTIIVNQEK